MSRSPSLRLSWPGRSCKPSLPCATRTFITATATIPTSTPGGLEFPRDDAPDYLDFAYFAFVIGMTCQVSDVAISSKPLRTLALLQGVLSFGFNTIILALAINTIADFFKIG